jgi:glucose-1-phosphate adenylyltransferase
VNYARFKQSSYRLIAVAKQGCFIYWMMSFILILLLKCHLIYDPSLLREQVDTTVLGLDADRAKEMPYIASMGIYVVSKEAMISLLRDHFPDANDFGSEVIPGATKLGRKVQAYLYDGYWEDIGTIEAFYNANLGITKKPVPDFSFYDRSAPIYTQARFLPPSMMLDADVMDSVIGEGCVIKNCKIYHSVVGLRSWVAEGAVIQDALLMGSDYYEVGTLSYESGRSIQWIVDELCL